MGNKKDIVYVIDADGLGGGVVDHLRHIGEQNIVEFHGNEKPLDNQRYYNLKAEIWFNAAKLFEDRLINMCDDETLINELASMKYKYNAGRLILEKKEDYKI